MRKNRPLPVNASEELDYNRETGEIIRKSTGTVQKAKNGKGYIVVIMKDRKTYQGARLAWFLETGEDPGDMFVDHINRVRHDNRVENLRWVTRQQNCENRIFGGTEQQAIEYLQSLGYTITKEK